MKLKVSRVKVWAATIEDRPGGLAQKLEALARAKANLEFVIARRTPERGSGQGVVFVTPLRTAAQQKAAVAAGFIETSELHSVRIEGADKPGLGTMMTRALANAGINLRGLSAAAVGKKFVAYLALDTAADADNAAKALKAMK